MSLANLSKDMLQIILSKLQSTNRTTLEKIIQKHEEQWNDIFEKFLDEIDYEVKIWRCDHPGCPEYEVFVDRKERKSNIDTYLNSCIFCSGESFYCFDHDLFTELIDVDEDSDDAEEILSACSVCTKREVETHRYKIYRTPDISLNLKPIQLWKMDKKKTLKAVVVEYDRFCNEFINSLTLENMTRFLILDDIIELIKQHDPDDTTEYPDCFLASHNCLHCRLEDL